MNELLKALRQAERQARKERGDDEIRPSEYNDILPLEYKCPHLEVMRLINGGVNLCSTCHKCLNCCACKNYHTRKYESTNQISCLGH